MIYIFWSSLFLNFLLGVGIFNLLRKLELYETSNESLNEYFHQLQYGLNKVLQQIRSVDLRGAFEADDEVGIVYKGISGMVQSLNAFVDQESDAAQEKN